MISGQLARFFLAFRFLARRFLPCLSLRLGVLARGRLFFPHLPSHRAGTAATAGPPQPAARAPTGSGDWLAVTNRPWSRSNRGFSTSRKELALLKLCVEVGQIVPKIVLVLKIHPVPFRLNERMHHACVLQSDTSWCASREMAADSWNGTSTSPHSGGRRRKRPRTPASLGTRRKQRQKCWKLDPARDLWILGSGKQLSHRHLQVLAGIEPDDGRCRYASEHRRASFGPKNLPLITV